MSPRPSSRSRAMTSNSRSTSAGLSEEVGSSKMTRLASSAERLGDLDELALRRGEPAHLGVERQDVVVAERGRGSPARAGAATAKDRRPGRPSSGRKMFSSTDMSGASEVSCATMAMPARSASRAERHGAGARRRSRSRRRRGLMWPVMTLRQGRLAGAVGAHQAVDLADADLEVRATSARVLSKRFATPMPRA